MTFPVHERSEDFSYRGFTLFEAIDALMAYDVGARDSGIDDEGMRKALVVYLERLAPDEFRRTCALFARVYLTDRAIAEGYGVEDVVQFADWIGTMRDDKQEGKR
jgi:hypothetical protein